MNAARVERLAQAGVVLGAARLEVGGQVLVGVAPPVSAGDPDLLAAQVLAQRLEGDHLVDHAHDPLAAVLVGAVDQRPPVLGDPGMGRDVLPGGVVRQAARAGVAADQRQGLDDRLAGGAAGTELQHLEQLDQPAPVVPGVGGPQRGLHGAPVGGSGGLVLGDQVAQRLLARHRVDHGADGVVRAGDRGLGEPEQQRLLPGDLAELADQFLGDLPLGPGADPVHGRDQQVRQGVGDLPLPLVHQRGQQGQHQRLRVAAQVGRGLHRGAGPPGGDHLRRDAGEHAVRQAHRADRVQLADLGEHGFQAHAAGNRLDQRQRRWVAPSPSSSVGGRQGGQRSPVTSEPSRAVTCGPAPARPGAGPNG